MSTSDATDPDLIDRLEQCKRELEQAQARVDEHGEEELEQLQDAYEQFRGTLEIYQEKVVGDEGDIKTIVEFQSQLDDVMKEIPRGVLLREVFEDCDEYLQQKWFSDSDFEHVYEQLEPIADLTARLDERNEARREYREARRDVEAHLRRCKTEIADLERLSDLADADLDAPTELLREPIEEYNETILEAFREFKQAESAREIIRFLARMEQYPLIHFESPPDDITEYVSEYPPGREPIPTLLEYADYSQSKLEHYVDNPHQLKHAIEGRRAYLSGLDGKPLTVSWPPPEAETLQFRCRELTSAVNRIDPAAVEQLRNVEALHRETEYDRLRNAAVVRQELSDEERERLRSGAIEMELEELYDERDRLQETLDEYPKL